MSLKISKEKIIFILLLAMYLFFRFFLIKDGNFIFFYDQGRDAILAREIYQDHDLKIQGPTASGSSDTLFHNVFYYYLLALLYWAFAGNPQLVSYGLFSLSIIFLLINFFVLVNYRQTKINILAIQQERFYQDDLALIEKTYQLAGDESFSISVLASPYGTIPSWAYLYEYYAKENNLTAPSFYGPSQNGLVAESLLREEVFPLQKHFSIIEPGFSETDKLRVDYQLEQDNYYPVKGQSYFGSLILEDRSL